MLPLLLALLAPTSVVQVFSVSDDDTLEAVRRVETAGHTRAWIAADGELTVQAQAAPTGARHVAGVFVPRGLTADGRYLVDENDVRDSASGTPIFPTRVAAAPSGRGWMTAGAPLGVAEHAPLDGVRLRRLAAGRIAGLVFVETARGPRLVAHTEDPPSLHVLAGPEWRPVRRVELAEEDGCGARLLPAGEQLLVRCEAALRRFDPLTGALQPVATDAVEAAVTPDGRWLVIAREGGFVRIDSRAPQRPQPLKIPVPQVDGGYAIALSPDGARLAVTHPPGGVALYAVDSGREVWRRPPPAEPGTTFIGFAPDGTLYLSPEYEAPYLFAVDARAARPQAKPVDFAFNGSWPSWSAGRTRTAYARQSAICLGDAGGCVMQVGWPGRLNRVALSADGGWVAASFYRGPLAIARLDGGALPGADDPPGAKEDEAWQRPPPYAELGRRLHPWTDAATGLDRQGRWRVLVSEKTRVALADGRRVQLPEIGEPFALAGDRLVWSGGWEQTGLKAFDLETGKARALTDPHRAAVEYIARSPDGRRLASADSYGRIVLWRVATLEPVGAIETGRRVTALHFGPQGRRLVAALGSPIERPATP